MKLLMLLFLTSCASYTTIHNKQLNCIERFIKLDVTPLEASTICDAVFKQKIQKLQHK